MGLAPWCSLSAAAHSLLQLPQLRPPAQQLPVARRWLPRFGRLGSHPHLDAGARRALRFRRGWLFSPGGRGPLAVMERPAHSVRVQSSAWSVPGAQREPAAARPEYHDLAQQPGRPKRHLCAIDPPSVTMARQAKGPPANPDVRALASRRHPPCCRPAPPRGASAPRA